MADGGFRGGQVSRHLRGWAASPPIGAHSSRNGGPYRQLGDERAARCQSPRLGNASPPSAPCSALDPAVMMLSWRSERGVG